MYAKTVAEYHCDAGNDKRSQYCQFRGRIWYKLTRTVWIEGFLDQVEMVDGGLKKCDWCTLYHFTNTVASTGEQEREETDTKDIDTPCRQYSRM